jgi:hypothetical protein
MQLLDQADGDVKGALLSVGNLISPKLVDDELQLLHYEGPFDASVQLGD